MTTPRPSLSSIYATSAISSSSSTTTTTTTAACPSASAAPLPSPAKRSNPFARPSVSHSPSSFSRTSLLPTLPSPSRPVDPLATPSDKFTHGGNNGQIHSAGRARTGWRILWRGGLEIGKDGWRFEGVTFVAQLSFPPPTPSIQIANPFDVPIQAQTPSTTIASSAASPFHALAAGDTDLCLSFESMKGRKYFQVKGVVDLPEDEVLEGGDGAGVQMCIAPTSPLLIAYFTGLLCRSERLSSSGRTSHAIAIGLGDDIDSAGSTVLVYGQRFADAHAPTLRLCVGRRKPPAPPPSEKKIRPGEPLPRPPLFFPSKAPKRPPPPFPRARTARSMSRAPSTSSIYAPPPAPVAPPPAQAPAPVSGRTPGRRGEKRARSDHDKDDERRRKAGKIVKPSASGSADLSEDKEAERDEDIFGKRGSSMSAVPPDRRAQSDSAGEAERKAKRPKIPLQVSDNKATIRKQTLIMLERRGYPRSHEMFKDVFGMTTKGCYFAFRDRLEDAPLDKADIQKIVTGHIDMYLASSSGSAGTTSPRFISPPAMLSQVVEEDEGEDAEEGGDASAVFGSDVLDRPKLEDRVQSEEALSEVFTSEGVISEDPLSEEVFSAGLGSEEPLSEEPFSEGMLSEEPISDGVLSEEPIAEGGSPIFEELTGLTDGRTLRNAELALRVLGGG